LKTEQISKNKIDFETHSRIYSSPEKKLLSLKNVFHAQATYLQKGFRAPQKTNLFIILKNVLFGGKKTVKKTSSGDEKALSGDEVEKSF
jgi:hypothetical protein